MWVLAIPIVAIAGTLLLIAILAADLSDNDYSGGK